MPASPPFVDPSTNTLDTDQIVAEAVPLAKLVGLFAAVALVPMVLSFVALGGLVGVLLTLLTQFVLAVGAGIVLIYVIARGRQLTGQ
ncbi:hypothetical protein SAMN06269185_1421 [Natronoarchaeum philippinense]|uniref:Uncharacterized protein n=1 Tax=Natronoarchaeum philippinense TaxID=558529 RepID=A0A285NW78_NATPI|nr:hypothetical protein [Natronoarchaeum philippinense]SNZ11891.1 hypothetical protein SAMN06269185_1421 [Natronoarchaeum philippinense]